MKKLVEEMCRNEQFAGATSHGDFRSDSGTWSHAHHPALFYLSRRATGMECSDPRSAEFAGVSVHADLFRMLQSSHPTGRCDPGLACINFLRGRNGVPGGGVCLDSE